MNRQKHIIALNMSKYKSIKFLFFLEDMKMDSRTTNKVITAKKEVREPFNELRTNLSREEITELEKNSIKKKLHVTF